MRAVVDGPTVELWFDGQLASAWTMLDGRPVQGLPGFFTSQGAMRVIAPEVQRQDRTLWSAAGRAMGGGLHPERAGGSEWNDLVGRPVSGLPLGAAGTLLMWFPAEEGERIASGAAEWRAQVEAAVSGLLAAVAEAGASQCVTVVLPRELGDEAREALRARFAEAPPGGLEWAVHARGSGLDGRDIAVGGWRRPQLLFADPAGVLRWAQPHTASRRTLPRALMELLRQYQDHARPGVAGAAE
jgi:hypothetical protein